MRSRLLLILLLLAMLPRAHAQRASPASLDVGDITFDPSLDDPNFHLNDSTLVFQYYNSNAYWLDHKDAYRTLFKNSISALKSAPLQSGWLTIRFIINTEGVTGRFRIFEMDSAYQPFHFVPQLPACLLSTVKIAHWEPARYRGKAYDTYQYITVHFEQGRMVDITP